MSNIALRLAGPAVITYKGATFASKGDIQLALENSTFELQVDAYGTIDNRSAGKLATVRFVPVGAWENLTVLWPANLQVIGGLTTPVRSFLPAAVNTGTDVITITAHGFESGAAVRLFSFGVLPAGLVAGTLYYLRAVSADTITLHATRAAAVAGTDPVDITDAGTGTHRLIEQEPLVMVTAEGERYTFHVAALANFPAINGVSQDTLIGEVVFDLFRKAGVPATTADSLYTLDAAAYVPPDIDPDDILTQAYTFTWGNAPWQNLETVDGIRWAPTFTTEDVVDDAEGVLAKRITGVAVTVSCRPLGLTPAAVNAALLLQGAGAGRGASLASGDDFVMEGDGVEVVMTNAGLRAGPQAAGRSVDRIGELSWFASRKYNAGSFEPLFTVGTGA